MYRKTNETEITLVLGQDTKINTGVGFFDHMLELFSFQSGVALNLECKGDLNVDAHHTVEDVGIILGQAFKELFGDKKGINRYGEATVPMDETLAACNLDISNRPYLIFNAEIPSAKVGDFETELTEEFFRAFAVNSGITLHINVKYGKNSHHIIEAIFKSFGRALKQAMIKVGDDIASTKGVL
ncbi:MAG: imidazoleglycerol-phosphate dehydratase HisB [Puniceicoccales bacterium]|jgi:imidazoleglycerol-phosphate dehydratase|nr:imidazoleglycerol-phosphate dehydratase HisB [Puniceicoccales bacterium]